MKLSRKTTQNISKRKLRRLENCLRALLSSVEIELRELASMGADNSENAESFYLRKLRNRIRRTLKP